MRYVFNTCKGIELGVLRNFNFFLKFSNKLIKYFYSNLSTPYVVPLVGSPGGMVTVLKEHKDKNGGFCKFKHSRSRAENYIGVNGTMFLNTKTKEKKHGDLECDEYHSFYMGRHIVRNGDRPQRYMRAPDPAIEFYHNHSEVFNSLGYNIDKTIVVNGCFKTNKETIQRTMIPEVKSEFSGHPSMSLIKKKKEAIKTVIRKLKIRQLAKCEAEDMFNSNFNMETYPGFTYSEYLKIKKKKDAIPIASQLAMKRWQNIEKASRNGEGIKRSKIFPSTYTVGALNKRDSTYENNDVITSRAVHMPEFHAELQCAPWIDSISTSIKDKKRGCIYIGNSYVEYERLIKDTDMSKSIIEGDVKRFDSSLYLTDIRIAVAISRLYYDLEDESIDNHFLAIFDSVAIKDYYTPGGFVYRLINGLPSGVKSTSLYGSFINLLNLVHCCSNKNLKKVKFIIGGDDFLISSEDKMDEYDLDHISNKSKEIGIIFKVLKFKSFDSPNTDDRPIFYKYTIKKGEPITPIGAVIERVFTPYNKRYKNNFELLTFLDEFLPSLAAPRSHLLLFYKFYSELFSIVTKREYTIADAYKEHLIVYNKVISRKINNRLLNASETINSFKGINLYSSKSGIPSENIFKSFVGGNKDEVKLLIPSYVKEGKKISDLIKEERT